MNKIFYSLWLLLITTGLQATFDADRPEAKPNKELNSFYKFMREFEDFMGLEGLGFQALKKENEDYIRAIIAELGLDNFCIEIRGMSNSAQRGFGRANAFVTQCSKLKYLYISEDWFESLPADSKQALVRHELMHLKHNHILKKIGFVFVSIFGLFFLQTKVLKNLESYDPFLYELTLEDDPRLLTKYQLLFETLRVLVVVSPWLLLLPLNSKYSRFCEKEADIEAAKTMLNKDGFVDLFNEIKINVKDPKSKFFIKRLFSKLIKPLKTIFRSHPKLSERIAYIKNLENDTIDMNQNSMLVV